MEEGGGMTEMNEEEGRRERGMVEMMNEEEKEEEKGGYNNVTETLWLSVCLSVCGKPHRT
jgi:hypothetical protein